MTLKSNRRSVPALAVVAHKSIRRLHRAIGALASAALQCARAGITSVLILCMVPLGLTDLYAQQPAPERGGFAQLSYADLDQLVAPIALYPDALVAQILAGSTYSSQIVQADRFLQQHIGVPPQELARIVNTQPWDPSVKALTEFPSVLANLDRNLDWTTRLGDVYYNQPQDVMGAIQAMRQRAYAAGTLRPTPQEAVVYQPTGIVIAPVNPAVYYVPVYNPWVVYGAPIPVYPAYYYVAPPPVGGVAVAAAIGFTAGVFVGAFASYGWGYAHWAPSWYSHTVVFNHTTYVSHSLTVVNRGYYGAYDHSAAARAYNHQVFVGPNGGVATRTVARGNGQTNVRGRGPDGGTYERSTTHYPGGNSTTVTGPNGGTANRTVTDRGTGNVTATTTGPNGGTATRTTQSYAGGGATTVTGPKGQSETTAVSGRGTGDATVTRSGARGNRTWHQR